jgi:hypothetical protein
LVLLLLLWLTPAILAAGQSASAPRRPRPDPTGAVEERAADALFERIDRLGL